MAGFFASSLSFGGIVPECADCFLPQQPSNPNVYVKSPVQVNRGTVTQKIVFPGKEIRQDFAVRAGRNYYFYLLPHSGNPDLGVSAKVISPFQMPDWQWSPNPGSGFEGRLFTPLRDGFVSTKVRGSGSVFSSYSLVVFER